MRLLLFLGLLLPALPVAAQWQPVNKPVANRDFDDLVSGPGFVSTFYNTELVYTSRDAGTTWASTGLNAPLVGSTADIFSHPRDGKVYAWLDEKSGARWGYYRSSDGLTWTRLHDLVQNNQRLFPSWHKNTLYTLERGPTELLALNADEAGWTTLNANFTVNQSNGAELMGSAGERMYLVSYENNQYRVQWSADGTAWQLSTDSLSYDSGVVEVGSVALAAAQPARTVLGLVNGKFVASTWGVRRSTNGGQTWRGVQLPRTRTGQQLIPDQILPVGGDRAIAVNVYGGYFFSTQDAGASWTLLPDSLGDGRLAQRPMATDGQYVFVWNLKTDQILRRPIGDFFGTASGAEIAGIPGGISIALGGAQPVQGAARFRIALGTAARGTLTIFDALGRQVAAQEVVADEASFDASGWPAGRYAARLAAGNRSATALFIVVR